MITTIGHAITPELKAYADAVKACGDYSIANPTSNAHTNPFWKPVTKAHQKATGSVRIIVWCPRCSFVSPNITDDLKTACCGWATLNFNDHRPASRRR